MFPATVVARDFDRYRVLRDKTMLILPDQVAAPESQGAAGSEEESNVGS